MSEQEKLGGEILGSKFEISTTNLLQVVQLLILAGVIYLGYTQMTGIKNDALKVLREDHERLAAHLLSISNNQRLIAYNLSVPEADRVPLDLPADLFPAKKK